jgi:ribonuclease VapC
MATKIFDSFAMLAFFRDEAGSQYIEDLLMQAQEGKISLVMCVVNVGEVFYSAMRTDSQDSAEQFIEEIQSMPIEIVEVDWELTRQAAIYKSKGNISYADCFAAALAKIRNGEVVTGDKEFKALEKEIKITWLK